MKIEKVVIQFIPIILFFLLISYSKFMAIFSNTILGKLISVSLIIIYTSIDRILGLFVCSLVILYYQMDYVESMLNMGIFTNFNNDSDNVGLNIVPSVDMGNNAYYGDDEMYLGGSKYLIGEGFSNHKQEFREQNCEKGVLKYKNMDVRNDMADLVFEEIKFENDNNCNVCSDACSFSIIETKLNNEIELLPKNRNNKE
jgi:hypothetical protein